MSLLCNEPLSLHFGDVHFSTCIYNEQEALAASPTVLAAHVAWKEYNQRFGPGLQNDLKQIEDPRVNLPISPRKIK